MSSLLFCLSMVCSTVDRIVLAPLGHVTTYVGPTTAIYPCPVCRYDLDPATLHNDADLIFRGGFE